MPSRLDLDLSRTSVFLDFDGTVTAHDTGVYLCERLAPPEWKELDAQYAAGLIGSRECVLSEWDLLPRDEDRLRALAREVAIDPDFPRLVEALRREGAQVTVVSDGFGFYAEEVCARLGVALLANTVDWSTFRLEFPHEDRCCACSTCGTCKQAPIKDARYAGRTAVLVGDGTSDRKAALLADVLFAKGNLAQWCEVSGIAYVPFVNLGDVFEELLGDHQ